MGVGDELMASGMARGAAARGKRIAFGNGKRIIWGPHCPTAFRGNPNVAAPGSEGAKDLEWVPHYKGHRLYVRLGAGRWIWNMDFRPAPGEVFFDGRESALAQSITGGFVLIEPNVPAHKSVAVNKQWPVDRFQAVADQLVSDGHNVVQLAYQGARYSLQRVERIATATFRDGLAVLSRAALYIGHEGGMHHGAATVNVPGVVLFGGFIPPQVTGYDMHINLAAGGPACGSLNKCNHCRDALDAITIEQVTAAARSLIDDRSLRSAI
jgi:Glycosyltransferase family 9 (heptosyltransferase)